MGAAVCFAILFGCEGEVQGGCRGFCESADVECAQTSVDECVAQCEEFEAELPAECRPAWSDLRDCAAEAEWTCEVDACTPSEDEPCGSEPTLLGCSQEISAFEDCGGGDDCADAEGAGTSTIDGRVVEFDHTSACGECDEPPLTGAPPNSECARATDCKQYCCACPDASVYVQVCIDGSCASEAEACDDSLGACDGFH